MSSALGKCFYSSFFLNGWGEVEVDGGEEVDGFGGVKVEGDGTLVKWGGSLTWELRHQF